MTINEIREQVYETALGMGEGLHRSEAIFRTFADSVTEAGFLTNPQWTPLRFKVSGHTCAIEGYDIDEEDGLLTVFALIDSHAHTELDRPWEEETCPKKELERAHRDLIAAINAISDQAAPELDVSDPARGLMVSLSSEYRVSDGRVACCIFTTGRVTSAGALEIGDSAIRTTVWDIDRLSRALENGREPLVADFTEYGGLPTLISAHEVDEIAAGRVAVLIAKVPGVAVASLYNRYRMRLLERNVRAFLQFTGKVNKGIRTTIHEEPSRFLSFNNGISTTASEVSLRRGSDGFYHLLSAKDFQIVNGGQTTASIARCVREDGVDVSAVSVVMKLTVVPETQIDELVPRISRFANSQNRVQDADFFANSPWHVALERHSRSIEADRDADSHGQPFYWFYERVRGQYADELSKFRTKSQKNAYRDRHPARARFTKTDLARYLLAWEQEAQVVSLGAQKCFVRLMHVLGDSGADAVGGQLPSDEDFRRICCLSLIQRHGEKISRELGILGYRANLVAYAIMVISVATDRRLPWRRLWTEQRVTPELDHAMRIAIPACDQVIRESARGRNVSEWAKKNECRDIVLAAGIDVELRPAAEWDRFSVRDMARPQATADLNRILHKLGKNGWSAIIDQARADRVRTIWIDVADTFVSRHLPSGRAPSDKQGRILRNLMKRYLELRIVKQQLTDAERLLVANS